MTIPTFEGGGIPEQFPSIPESPSIRFHTPTDIQALRQLASMIFILPKGMHLPSFHRLPVPKVIFQHQVVSQLIAKFNPSLVQLAILTHKIAPAEKLEKSEPLPPKEASTQRDETTAKGLGHDLVNIEVFQAGKGESQRDPKFSPGTGEGQAGITPKEGKSEIAQKEGKSEISQKEGKSNISQKDGKQNEELGIEPKVGRAEAESNSQPPLGKEASSMPARLPSSENQGTQTKFGAKDDAKVEISQSQKPSKDEQATEKNSVKPSTHESVKSEAKLEKSAPNALPNAQPDTSPKSSEKSLTGVNKIIPVEKLPGEKEIPVVHAGKDMKVHKEEHHQAIQKDQVAIIPHVLATRSEELTPMTQHRIFQTLDPNASMLVPPWLSMLLPNLTKAEISSERSRKGGKGAEAQHPHKLSDILFMLLCANLSGMHSLRDAIPFIEKRENWFKVVLGLRHGLPPRQLIFWLLATLDSTLFDQTMRLWLQEVQGEQSGSQILVDVIILQTPLGFILGKLHGSEGNPGAASKLIEGFSLKNFISMVRSKSSYGTLLERIRRRGADYIAEVDEELTSIENSQIYESYLDGVERVVVEEWIPSEDSETNLRVHSEIFSSQGISKSERFYVSSLKSPNEDFFDLFRIQRPYENKLFWLINSALRFPSIGNAFERCTATLQNIEQYAKEVIQFNGDGKSSVEQQMQKASKDLDFLLQLTRL
ncbi:MAG: transposase family protein [Parachlamydiaceae bacterium]|nr:transposase family protein [Parachlamydiaceae bacterium]